VSSPAKSCRFDRILVLEGGGAGCSASPDDFKKRKRFTQRGKLNEGVKADREVTG
jgi:hypothetical protein